MMGEDTVLMSLPVKVQVIDAKTPKMRFIRMDGKDGGWAWCVALSACLINFIFAGLGRMAGILYVAFIEIFNVNRKSATAPFSIRSTTRNLLGPVVGIFGQQYGVRTTTLAGALLGTFSASCCYFAEDMTWVTVFWGGINGIGTAFTTTLPQVVIGQYFDKHHTTASGLAFSGGCVGSFLFPVLIEYLLQQYGLQGTFLILSGVVMHSIPAAMILRKPHWIKERNQKRALTSKLRTNHSSVECTPLKSDMKNESSSAEIEKSLSLSNGFSVVEVSPDADCESLSKDVSKQKFYWFYKDNYLITKIVVAAMNYRLCNEVDQKSIESFELSEDNNAEVAELLNVIYNKACSQRKIDRTSNYNGVPVWLHLKNKQSILKIRFFEWVKDLENNEKLNEYIHYLEKQDIGYENDIRNILLEIIDVSQIYRRNGFTSNDAKTLLLDVKKVDSLALNDSKTCLTDDGPPLMLPIEGNGFKKHIITALKLNMIPIFMFVSLCRTVHFCNFMPLMICLVDFGMDKGLPEEDGKYLIADVSAGDLVGRLCLGWVTDMGFLSLSRFMLVTMILQGVITGLLPLMTSRWSLLITLVFYGALQGSLFIRHPVLLHKYLESDVQSIAMGCLNLPSGVIGLIFPPIIGYFRDTLGSYDKLFYINGALGVIVGLLWLFEGRLKLKNIVSEEQL